MLYITMVLYVLSLVLFASSMSNPARPGIEPLTAFLVASTVAFGVALYVRLHGRR